MKYEDWKRIQYFKPWEFRCPCKRECSAKEPSIAMDYRLIDSMDLLRSALGKPVTITSGLRCEPHNREVGGTDHSQHLVGRACDFVCKGVLLDELYLKCEKVGFAGIILYPKHMHVDTAFEIGYQRGVQKKEGKEPVFILSRRTSLGKNK